MAEIVLPKRCGRRAIDKSYGYPPCSRILGIHVPLTVSRSRSRLMHMTILLSCLNQCRPGHTTLLCFFHSGMSSGHSSKRPLGLSTTLAFPIVPLILQGPHSTCRVHIIWVPLLHQPSLLSSLISISTHDPQTGYNLYLCSPSAP